MTTGARSSLAIAVRSFGHGQGYRYAHDFEGGWVDQEYVPADVTYYEPTDRGFEATIRERMAEIANRRQQASGGRQPPGAEEPPPPEARPAEPKPKRGKKA